MTLAATSSGLTAFKTPRRVAGPGVPSIPVPPTPPCSPPAGSPQQVSWPTIRRHRGTRPGLREPVDEDGPYPKLAWRATEDSIHLAVNDQFPQGPNHKQLLKRAEADQPLTARHRRRRLTRHAARQARALDRTVSEQKSNRID